MGATESCVRGRDLEGFCFNCTDSRARDPERDPVQQLAARRNESWGLDTSASASGGAVPTRVSNGGTRVGGLVEHTQAGDLSKTIAAQKRDRARMEHIVEEQRNIGPRLRDAEAKLNLLKQSQGKASRQELERVQHEVTHLKEKKDRFAHEFHKLQSDLQRHEHQEAQLHGALESERKVSCAVYRSSSPVRRNSSPTRTRTSQSPERNSATSKTNGHK